MFKTIKSVIRHSLVYGLGDLAAKVISFVLIPLYTHYLTPENYGTLELLDLSTYVVGLLLAWVSEAVMRFYYEYSDDEKKKTVVATAMLTTWAVSLVFLVTLLLTTSQISDLVFHSSSFARFYTIVFITMVINLGNEIPMALLRIQQKSGFYVGVNLTKLVMNLSLNILLLVYFEMGVMGILIGNLITNSAVGSFMIFRTVRQVRLHFSWKVLAEMLKYGLPLIGSWAGMFVLNFGDRFLLQRMASLADVGVYALAYKFGMIPNILVLGPFLGIWAPKRFEIASQADGKQINAAIFTYFFAVQLFVALGVASLIPDVIRVLAPPEYLDASNYVPLLLIAYIIYGMYQFTQLGILYAKQTRHLAIATVGGAVINLLVNFILIPDLKVWGATIATTVSFSFLLLYSYPIAQRLYHIPYEFKRLGKLAATAGGLYIIAHSISLTNLFASVPIKLLIVLAFPFVLFAIRFYSEDELAKLTEWRMEGSQRFREMIRNAGGNQGDK